MSVRDKWSGKRDNGNKHTAELVAKYGDQLYGLIDELGVEDLVAIINHRINESKKTGDCAWVYNLLDKITKLSTEHKNAAKRIIDLVIEEIRVEGDIEFTKIQSLVMLAVSGIPIPSIEEVRAGREDIVEPEFASPDLIGKSLYLYNSLVGEDKHNLVHSLISGASAFMFDFVEPELYKILLDTYNDPNSSFKSIVDFDFKRITNTVKPYISKAWTDHEKLKLVVILTDNIRGDINLGVYGAVDFDSMQKPMGRPNIQSVHELIVATPDMLEEMRSDIEQIVSESIMFQQDPLAWNNY